MGEQYRAEGRPPLVAVIRGAREPNLEGNMLGYRLPAGGVCKDGCLGTAPGAAPADAAGIAAAAAAGAGAGVATAFKSGGGGAGTVVAASKDSGAAAVPPPAASGSANAAAAAGIDCNTAAPAATAAGTAMLLPVVAVACGPGEAERLLKLLLPGCSDRYDVVRRTPLRSDAGTTEGVGNNRVGTEFPLIAGPHASTGSGVPNECTSRCSHCCSCCGWCVCSKPSVFVAMGAAAGAALAVAGAAGANDGNVGTTCVGLPRPPPSLTSTAGSC